MRPAALHTEFRGKVRHKAKENTVIDEVDRVILSQLEIDSRLSFKDLAAKVNLSANAVAERVRRLQERGIIRRFTIELNFERIGLPVHALVEIKLEPAVTAPQFQAHAALISGVRRALVTTGRYDLMLEVVAADQQDLQRIIEALRQGGLARETYTSVVVASSFFRTRR